MKVATMIAVFMICLTAILITWQVTELFAALAGVDY